MEKKIGRYGILANLAKTSYGAVYLLCAEGGGKLLCHQVLLHKVRAAELAAVEPMVELSLRCRHENILFCLEAVRSPKALNLIYEFFSETNLGDFLATAALGWEAHAGLIRQLREVVKYLDAKQLQHSHFRLQNFLVDARTATLKVLDPVVAVLQTLYARAQDAAEFAYWPPEELAGAEASPKGDVWSAGLVAWQIALGPDAFPFETRTKAAFVAALARPPPRPATPSAALNELLALCLRREPAERLSPGEFYLHAFFTGQSRAPSPPGTPRRFSTRAEDRAPFFLQSLRRSRERAVAACSFDFYRDRVFELEVVARAVRGALALVTHNWQRLFLQYYNGLTLIVLNKALLQGDNLMRSLKERVNHYGLADFDRFLAGVEQPRVVELAAREAHRVLKDLDDAVFAQLTEGCVSKNYADEVRARIFRHLGDEEQFRAFARETRAHVRAGYRRAVEPHQPVAVRHALHLFDFVLAGRVLENLEEF